LSAEFSNFSRDGITLGGITHNIHIGLLFSV